MHHTDKNKKRSDETQTLRAGCNKGGAKNFAPRPSPTNPVL